ncbi:MAG: toll/interleukin-1 receptor domain-containing protein [Armatimonadetes bacterium]|nr:toll/interleukin-1 receptor domain-containing protein [Armatimonadota bacterium]
MEYHVFLSYSHQDRPAAENLGAALTSKGFRVWRDDSIGWGADFWKTITQAILDSQALILVVPNAGVQVDWVVRETQFALSKGVPVLPVLLKGRKARRPLATVIGRLHYIRVNSEQPADAAEEIERELRYVGVGTLSSSLDRKINWEHIGGRFQFGPGSQQRLDVLAELTRRRFQGTPGPQFWTVHGLRHANSLLAILADLLHPRWCEDEHYAFCLSAAACLHDAGLVARSISGTAGTTRESISSPTVPFTTKRLSLQCMRSPETPN